MKNLTIVFICLGALFAACRKESDEVFHYYEIGLANDSPDWQDSTFIVATSDPELITAINAQLLLPVNQRKIVIGSLMRGNGGYNKNAGHNFKWRFREDDWSLTDLSIEIYDGRPYNDVDLNLEYWIDTVKRFSPWSSYIRREINRP